jgi:glycosyltransferase involved in cell wall biosynthesis
MNPLVSVIVPVYNGEKYLAEALDSVAAQDYAPLEVIVVDDGSTDGTAPIAQARAEVGYAFQPNGGVATARNHGLRLAQGSFIAFLDADDVWLPTKLRAQMDYLRAHSEVDGVLCKLDHFLEPGAQWPATFNETYYRQQPTAYLPSALVVRRQVFAQVGLFDARFRTGEDADWFFRARDTGVALTVVPEVLIRRRIHSGSLTHETRAVTADLLNVVRASINRKQGRDA